MQDTTYSFIYVALFFIKQMVLLVDQFLMSPRALHICVVDGWCCKFFFFCCFLFFYLFGQMLHFHCLSLKGWTPKEAVSHEGANWLLFWHCCCFKIRGVALNSLPPHIHLIQIFRYGVNRQGVLDESAGTPVNVAITSDTIIRHFQWNTSKCGVVRDAACRRLAINQSWAVREHLWHLWLQSCTVSLAAF